MRLLKTALRVPAGRSRLAVIAAKLGRRTNPLALLFCRVCHAAGRMYGGVVMSDMRAAGTYLPLAEAKRIAAEGPHQ